MSFKNKLQEYYQQHQKSVPKYTTRRAGGSEHKPFFYSTVACDGKRIKGEYSPTKKGAEQNAAQKAWEMINHKTDSPRLMITTNECVYVMVDMENVDVRPFLKKYNFDDNISIYGFISEQHPQAHTDFGKNLEVIRVPSSRKDAADVGIIIHATQIALNQNHSYLFIVSNDRIFGDSGQDFISGGQFYDF